MAFVIAGVNVKHISIDRLDWARIAADLDAEGYALLPGLLDAMQVAGLVAMARAPGAPVPPRSLAALGRGSGTLLPLPVPSPEPMAEMRETLYMHLAPIANRWSEALGLALRYPASWHTFVQQNRAAGQARALSALTHLREGDYQAMHQHTDSTLVFPLQLVALLSEPDADFTGGEFVMTEQRPRMQSRPMVLPLRRGDAALFAVAHRPVRGDKGHYRVSLRHAVSRVRGGEHLAPELLFHNAR